MAEDIKLCVLVKGISVAAVSPELKEPATLTLVELVRKKQTLGCSPKSFDVVPPKAGKAFTPIPISGGWVPSFVAKKNTQSPLELRIQWRTDSKEHSAKNHDFNLQKLMGLLQHGGPSTNPPSVAQVEATVPKLGTIVADLELIHPRQRLRDEAKVLEGKLLAHKHRLGEAHSDRVDSILKMVEVFLDGDESVISEDDLLEATDYVLGPLNDAISSLTSLGPMIRHRMSAGSNLKRKVEDACDKGTKFVSAELRKAFKESFSAERALEWVDGCVNTALTSTVADDVISDTFSITLPDDLSSLGAGTNALFEVVGNAVGGVLKTVPLGGMLFAAARRVVSGIIASSEVREKGSKLAERMVVLLRLLNDPEVGVLISEDKKADDLRRMLAMVVSTISAIGDLLESFNKRGAVMRTMTSSTVLEELEELKGELCVGFSQFHDCLSLRVMASTNQSTRHEVSGAMELLRTAATQNDEKWSAVRQKLDTLTAELANRQGKALEALRGSLKEDIEKMIASIQKTPEPSKDPAENKLLEELRAQVNADSSTLGEVKSALMKVSMSQEASEEARKGAQAHLEKLVKDTSADQFKDFQKELKSLRQTMQGDLQSMMAEITKRGIFEFEKMNIVTKEESKKLQDSIDKAVTTHKDDLKKSQAEVVLAVNSTHDTLVSNMQQQFTSLRDVMGDEVDDIRKMIAGISPSTPLDSTLIDTLREAAEAAVAKQVGLATEAMKEHLVSQGDETRALVSEEAAIARRQTMQAIRTSERRLGASLEEIIRETTDSQKRHLELVLSGKLLPELQPTLEKSMADMLKNAALNADGMYYGYSTDDEVKRTATVPPGLIFARLREQFQKKFKSFGSLTGEGDDNDSKLQSDKIYTTLTLMEVSGTAKKEAVNDDEPEAVATGIRKVDALDIFSVAQCDGCRGTRKLCADECHRLLLVEGRAGIGKTTFAQQISRVQPSPVCFFVTVQLGTLADKLPRGGQSLIAKLQLIAMSLIDSDVNTEFLSLPKEDVRLLAESIWASETPICWVLDGLDEVAQSDDPRIVNLLQSFLSSNSELAHRKKRPNDVVVVTSREERGVDYNRYLKDAPTLRIDAWSEKEIKGYVRRYFGCHDEAKSWVQEVVERLLLSSALGSFARLPITCELVCYVYRTATSEDAVGNVADVYKIALEKIYKVKKNVDKRDMKPDVSFADVEKLAKATAVKVARTSSQKGKVTFTLEVDANSPQAHKNTCKALVHSGFVRTVVTGDDMGSGTYQFLHKSFMEYFAAQQLSEDPKAMGGFDFDVQEGKQQRNLMVLLATILHANRGRLSAQITTFEKKLIDSFKKRYAEIKPETKTGKKDKQSENETMDEYEAKKREEERRQNAAAARITRRAVLRGHCGLTALAEILRVFLEPEGKRVAPDGNVPEQLPTVTSALFDGLDKGVSGTRSVKRSMMWSTSVPLLYGCFLQPLAEQDATAALAFAHYWMKAGNQVDVLQWRADGEFDRALLGAILFGAESAANLLASKHFKANVNLKLAAELGAVRLLEDALSTPKGWAAVRADELFMAARKNPTSLRCLSKLWMEHVCDPAAWLRISRFLILHVTKKEEWEAVWRLMDPSTQRTWRSIRCTEFAAELEKTEAVQKPKQPDGEEAEAYERLMNARDVLLATMNLQEHLVASTMDPRAFDDSAIEKLLENPGLSLEAIDVSSTAVTDKGMKLLSERPSTIYKLRVLNVSGTRGRITDASLFNFASQCKLLEIVDISDTGGMVTDATIAEVAETCPNLTHLNVSGTKGKVTDDGSMKRIAERCNGITHLDVSDTEGKITDAALKKLVSHGRLISLNVGRTKGGVTDKTLMDTAKACKALEVLDVQETSGKIKDAGIIAIAKGCPRLRVLVTRKGSRQINDASIKEVAKCCPNLEELTVADMDGTVTDAAIKEIALRCPKLRHLDVSRCALKITDDSIAMIADRCRDLRSLVVAQGATGRVSDESISKIANQCWKLESLDVSSTEGQVTDQSLLLVARNCRGLRRLNVGRTKGGITDATLEELAKKCPGLEELHVQHTFGNITDTGIKAIAENGVLRHLDVSRTKGKITNEAVKRVAEKCPNLRVFACGASENAISDDGIQEIAGKCPRLSTLIMSSEPGVTGASLESVADGCRFLSTLELEWTKITSEDSLVKVLGNCPLLAALNVKDTGLEKSDAVTRAKANQSCGVTC